MHRLRKTKQRTGQGFMRDHLAHYTQRFSTVELARVAHPAPGLLLQTVQKNQRFSLLTLLIFLLFAPVLTRLKKINLEQPSVPFKLIIAAATFYGSIMKSTSSSLSNNCHFNDLTGQ